MITGLSSYTYTWAVGVPGTMPDKPLDAYGLINKALFVVALWGIFVRKAFRNAPKGPNLPLSIRCRALKIYSRCT